MDCQGRTGGTGSSTTECLRAIERDNYGKDYDFKMEQQTSGFLVDISHMRALGLERKDGDGNVPACT